ncbi:MAG: hypothetical protein JWQ38_2044 [Flavipsychrobacter sp.]|nr:hypothetical protein [Flavipsychrobacter sp.]
MRKGLITLLVLVALSFSACHKTLKTEKYVQNYYPKVKTLSVEKLMDGTVKITGLVVSAGSTPVQYAGFCMDTMPNPAMLSHQEMADVVNADTFSFIYTGLAFPRKYYFRAWVANGAGYAIGSDVYADSIRFDTSMIPCRPPLQHLLLTNSTAHIDEQYSYIQNLTSSALTGYKVSASTGNHTIDLDFGKVPTSGIYQNSGASEPSDKTVLISVDHMRFSSDCAVYVQQIDARVIEITICSLSVKLSSGYSTYDTYDMATRFRASVR